MLVDSQDAFVLHSRPFRDSSLLVDFLTAHYGRVSAVVKGVRSSGKSSKQRRAMMQPFVPLVISWSGNSDLKTVSRFEVAASPLALQGEWLFSGMYVNELLVRLLQHYDEQPQWFVLYQEVLQGLNAKQPPDIVLRRFELALLQELGFGIDLTSDHASGCAVRNEGIYFYDVNSGFSECFPLPNEQLPNLFTGKDLLEIAEGRFSDSSRRAAKRLCRLALTVHLGDRPLKSRELFARS